MHWAECCKGALDFASAKKYPRLLFEALDIDWRQDCIPTLKPAFCSSRADVHSLLIRYSALRKLNPGWSRGSHLHSLKLACVRGWCRRPIPCYNTWLPQPAEAGVCSCVCLNKAPRGAGVMLDASHVLLTLTRATLVFLLLTCLLFSQWASCKLHKCMLARTALERRMIWKLIKSSANPTSSPWSACRFPLRIQRRDLVSVPVSFLLKDSSHLGWELRINIQS